MSITIETIREAYERISPHIIQTPMLRLQNLDTFLGCEVYVKAECMQITGSFKIRGALNKILCLSPGQLENGVVAASSGNHGRAVAYCAKQLGIPAVIVMPKTAPSVKIEHIKLLGAEVVLCDASERFRMAEQIRAKRNATMIPPFNDEDIIAGQGTAGLEIIEQCPSIDKVITPVSGGGLLGGVAAAIKALSPHTKVYGAEPAALPRYSMSLAAGYPVTVDRHPSVADALVADTPGSICFTQVRKCADAVAAVEDAFLLQGMKLLLREGKILAEPSSCIGLGAVLQGKISVSPKEKVCFLISGGNVGLDQIQNDIPVLEHDNDLLSVIMPDHENIQITLPKKAVFAFLGEKVDQYAEEHNAEILTVFKSVTKDFPVYLLEKDGQHICLVQAPLGAPAAVQILDWLIAYGVREIISAGSCGTLEDIDEDTFLVPCKALRDEGTSYHYLPPARFVDISDKARNAIEKALKEHRIPYKEVVTWSTDGFYRETKQKVAQRKNEGCAVVEMECSALAACAQFRGAVFGELLFAADTLADTEHYDERSWGSYSFEFALKICLEAVLNI